MTDSETDMKSSSEKKDDDDEDYTELDRLFAKYGKEELTSEQKRIRQIFDEKHSKDIKYLSSEELLVEQGLRDIYYNPKTGFQSAERLYQKAKDDGLKISRKKVKEWLLHQKTYTKFKPAIKRHKYQRTFVSDLGEQIQMDLVDMKKFKSKNKGYVWILTAVEILSRFAFTIPVYRKSTKYMEPAVKLVLEEFKDRFNKYPDNVQFDEGLEFYNVGVRMLLKSHDINYFSTITKQKASIVERFNRTLKTAMWKRFDAAKNNKWYNILDDLTDNYNNTKHSSILMKPGDVNKSNEDQVFVTLYGYGLGKFPLPKFKVGDRVRVSKYKTVFKKGYEANFTEEVFVITKVFRGDPNMYEIADEDNNELAIGKYYEQEMSLVLGHAWEEREVEKILKRRKGMVFVKWKGQDNKHNSWIPEKAVLTEL